MRHKNDIALAATTAISKRGQILISSMNQRPVTLILAFDSLWHTSDTHLAHIVISDSLTIISHALTPHQRRDYGSPLTRLRLVDSEILLIFDRFIYGFHRHRKLLIYRVFW